MEVANNLNPFFTVASYFSTVVDSLQNPTLTVPPLELPLPVAATLPTPPPPDQGVGSGINVFA